MILRADLIVPSAGAYIAAVRPIPTEWLAVNGNYLGRFHALHPGWGYMMAGATHPATFRRFGTLLGEGTSNNWKGKA